MKKKIIVIDAQNHKITESTVDTLEDMQKIVGGLIECATSLPNGDDVFVDEEGLFRNYGFGFMVQGAHQPFVGNGFVIGEVDDEGDSRDCKSSVDEIRSLIRFVPIHDTL